MRLWRVGQSLAVLPAWARPHAPARAGSRARTRNTASSPAMARPAGVVRSSASVSETKPTRDALVLQGVEQVGDRATPAIKRHTSTVFDVAAACGFQHFARASRLCRTGADSFTCITTIQPRVRHTRAGHDSAWEESAGHESTRGSTVPRETEFSSRQGPGQKPCAILLFEKPFFGHCRGTPASGRKPLDLARGIILL